MRHSILKHFSLYVCLITVLGALPGNALGQSVWKKVKDAAKQASQQGQQPQQTQQPGQQFRMMIDGKPVAQTEALSTLGINNDAIKWFEFLPDGTLLVLGQDENSLKRLAITPSSETSLATIGGGSAVAANH